MVEQTSAAARNLAGEVGGLTKQAEAFNVGGAMSRSPMAANSNGGRKTVLPIAAMANTVPPLAGNDWQQF